MAFAPDFLTCPAVPELPAPSVSLPSVSPRRRRWAGRVIVIVCAALAFLIAPQLFFLSRAALAAQQLQRTLAAAQASFRQADFAGAQQSVAKARAELDGVRRQLASASGLSFVPALGTQRQMLLQTGQAADEALAGIGDIAAAAQALEETRRSVSPGKSFAELAPAEKRAILSRVDEELPAIRTGREKVAIALDLWQHVPQDAFVPPVRTALQPFSDGLPKLKAQLDEALALAEVAVPLAGYPKEQTYLVLLQNADELRPTGGFIGTVGVLRVDAGDVKFFQFQDVYDVDGPVASTWKDAPPAALAKYLGVTAWFLRDRNWSPDFPQAAEQVLDTYARETGVTGFDGVIALQPRFFKRLLTLTGPLDVDGKTFGADDFFTKLEYDVEIGFLADGTPQRQRKEIVSRVGQALYGRLAAVPGKDWPSVAQAVSDSLAAKDMLVYARDPKLQSQLDARNWSDRIAASDRSDYLQVVDANLAALKTDGVMDKRIAYDLNLTSTSGAIATVTLTYHNASPGFDWRHTRYRDYVRVYVPEGSVLMSSDGAMLNDRHLEGGAVVPGPVDVMHDLGKTVFGAFWSIEPGETRVLKFAYRLPTSYSLLPHAYTLLVQKQPGSNTYLTMDVLSSKKSQERLFDAPLEQDQLLYVRQEDRH